MGHPLNILDILLVGRDCGFKFFIIDEEKQFVFDDRAAKGGTICLFFKFTNAKIFTLAGIAGQTVIGIEPISTAVEFIGAGFGDNIDVTAKEVTVSHVKRRNIHINRLDGINGNRCPLGGRSILGKTKIVILGHTINRNAVKPEVLTGNGHGWTTRYTGVHQYF